EYNHRDTETRRRRPSGYAHGETFAGRRSTRARRTPPLRPCPPPCLRVSVVIPATCCASVALLEIDAVLQRLAAQQAPVVVDEHRRDVPGNAQCRGVRRDQKIRRAPEHVIGGERLLLEYVEHRAGEPALPQRRGERRLVDDAAATGIDE